MAGGWGAGKGAGVYFTALFGTDCCWVVAGGAAALLHQRRSRSWMPREHLPPPGPEAAS